MRAAYDKLWMELDRDQVGILYTCVEICMEISFKREREAFQAGIQKGMEISQSDPKEDR